MPHIALGAGPPFPHHPDDTSRPIRNLTHWAGKVDGTAASVRTRHAPVPTDVDGLLSEPADDVVKPALRDAENVSRAATFAAGALGVFDNARRVYNRDITRLNEEWTTYSADTTVPDGATDDEAQTIHDQLEAVRMTFRTRQRTAEYRLDNAAHEAAGLLNRGPEAMSDPAVRDIIKTGLISPGGTGRGAPPLRIMTFNIGGGHANGWRDEKGFDQGDLPDLAKRILQGDPDVANLQEIFHGDTEALEEELEEQSGDEWTIAFSPASTKIQAGSGFFSDGSDAFGNAIAVRAPSDGDAGANGLKMIDATREELSGESFWGLGGGSGGDGRSMAAVTVQTASGERVTVSTAHTDLTEVSEEEQARQLREVRQHTERFAEQSGGDHTVITGDLNQVYDEDNDGTGIFDKKAPYYGVFENWTQDYDNAGDAADATLKNGNEVDYIWTDKGLEYSNVDRIPGDRTDIPGRDDNMSDHQGIALDVHVPDNDEAAENDPPPESRPSGPGASLHEDYWWRH